MGGTVIARLRRLVRPVVRRYTTVTIGRGPAAGMRIGLHLASNNYRSGDVEAPVQRAVADAMAPGGVFFDIGANVGFFTLVAAGAVDRTGTFVAFEPRPDVAAALSANAARNDLTVDVRPVAVGEVDGTTDLLVADHPGGATIEASKAVDTVETVTVDQVTIDRLVVDRGELPVPDVVKIDVEGAEPAVIRGMSATLALGRTTVVYEIDAATSEEVEAQYEEVDGLLTRLGYTSRRLDPSYENSGWQVIHAVARPPSHGG